VQVENEKVLPCRCRCGETNFTTDGAQTHESSLRSLQAKKRSHRCEKDNVNVMSNFNTPLGERIAQRMLAHPWTVEIVSAYSLKSALNEFAHIFSQETYNQLSCRKQRSKISACDILILLVIL
jgi:transposase-like protein